ncbi:phosphate acetyltransferase [Motilibacter deserti]|uniref:Phosphate acetyltransferase n=1 Tax=Motilibacter deserti TaxID=2714956 RepID=A0ABX0H032_9ACTN|nr:phosphate acetyltransferase [Motilibacter deserti]
MAQSLYLLSTGPRSGKAAVALGVLELLARHVDRLAVFRPLVEDGDRPDGIAELLRTRYSLAQSPEAGAGATYEEAALLSAGGTGPLVERVMERYAALAERADLVLSIGSDYTGPSPSTELELNAVLAANLGAPVITLVPALGRRPHEVAGDAAQALGVLRDNGCILVATIVNRAAPETADVLREQQRVSAGDAPTYVLPELPLLSAPTVEEVSARLRAAHLNGDAASLQREVESFVVGSGHVDAVLPLLRDGTLLVTAGDRTDLIVTAAAAAASPALPTPAGVLLTLGATPSPHIEELLRPSGLPVLMTEPDTYGTLHALEGLRGHIHPTSTRKVAAALGLFADNVDADELASRVRLTRSEAVTPLMFSAQLLERARSDRRHIVLPEGDDDRVLRAAEEIVRRGVARITLLGDPDAVAARAGQLGIDLRGVEVLDPTTSPLRKEFAETYAALRAHKGVTLDAAYDVVVDPSYFGTLLVHAGIVDGMVSGAAHTTAATIRPALEIIKTAPGVSLVSSTFLMCLSDRVLAFADCAVNPDPGPEQLAEIALSTAQTAVAFGIEPRVALVSYSTGTSGSGADVEKVRRAAELVAERRPDLPLAGPIQYDAAVDPGVGATKLPGNPVSGHATVLIFPDLNTGNTTYKAVQRAAGAIAVGPVLQGLRRPVNDLSRGCTVPDIVHTVAITAVQAQEEAAAG